jgi:predicted N-acetyltransferase YhbS
VVWFSQKTTVRSPVRRKTEQALTVTDLVFIVVDQLYRGKGVGSQLLQRGFAEARAAGIPFCVVSEPAARPFFEKSGFKEVVHTNMDLSVWAPPHSGFGACRLTGMVWRPE